MSKPRIQFSMPRGVFLIVMLICSGWTRAEVVVVVSAKSPVSTLTKEQSSDVFMGRAPSLTPVDQPESSPLRDEFYPKVTGKTAAQVKSYWAKMSFTGKGTPPNEGKGSDDIKKQLANNPNLVGYIEKSAVDNSVKVVCAVQ